LPGSSEIVVRPERPGDDAAAAQVHRRAFGAEGDAIAALVATLRATSDPHRTVSLLAHVPGDDEPAGNVMLVPALLDAPARLVDVLVLSPLGVRPEHQGRGVGSALVRAALAEAAARDEPLVFLEGNPAYYRRFGFEPGAGRGFRRPSLRIPPDAFQVFVLAAYQPWMTGTLVYPQAFWLHDAVGLRDG
jgi:putative acetyltransferase